MILFVSKKGKHAGLKNNKIVTNIILLNNHLAAIQEYLQIKIVKNPWM